jgi:hypothetical protein
MIFCVSEHLLTECLVVSLLISKTGSKRREIKHDGAFAPVLPISSISRNLTKEVKVRFAKLDVNAAPVRRRHGHQFRRFRIEEGTNPLQHLICSRHWERQFERVPLEPIFPLWFLSGIQAANQHVVVPSVDGPFRNFGVGDFVVEVWLFPEPEEDAFRSKVGDGAVFATVEEDNGCACFEGRDRECRLESELAACVCGNYVVGAPVEFMLGGPPLHGRNMSALSISFAYTASIKIRMALTVLNLPRNWL